MSDLDDHDDYPGYGVPNHPSAQWSHIPQAPAPVGYAPSIMSDPRYDPFSAGPDVDTTYRDEDANPFAPPRTRQNPFSPAAGLSAQQSAQAYAMRQEQRLQQEQTQQQTQQMQQQMEAMARGQQLARQQELAEESLLPPQHAPDKAPERTTISDDRSAGSNLEVRNLAALKNRGITQPSQDPRQAVFNVVDAAPINIQFSGQGRGNGFKLALGQGRSQQRFGRLAFEHVPNDAVHGSAEEDLEDPLTGYTLMKPSRSSQSEIIAKGQWIDDIEQADAGSHAQTAHIQMLQYKISGLQKELQQLESQQSRQGKKQYQVIYRIGRTCYFDHPEWTQGYKSIVSRIPVKNLDLFLERNKSIVFIVYRDFESSPARKMDTKIMSSPPKNVRESVRPVNRRLRKSFECLFTQDWRYESYLHHLRQNGEISAPYLFLYHNRRYWKDMTAQFPRTIREHLNLFAVYVSDKFGEEYAAADVLFARREISIELAKYFFQPGDILISRVASQYRGYVANSWPQGSVSAPVGGSRHPTYRRPIPESDDDDSDFDTIDVESVSTDSAEENDQDPAAIFRAYRMRGFKAAKKEKDDKSDSGEKPSKEFPISVYKWSFDGDFKREADEVVLKLSRSADSASTNKRTWNIDDLELYPLSFAPPAVVRRLRRRGTMFWECRKRCLISYQETSPDAKNESDERFMIDFHTFKKLHPGNKSHAITNSVETLSQAEMDRPEPPEEAFYYLVPPQTKGFNLRTKKWLDLNMDQIHPVVWNEQAFDSLVLDKDRKTKELITALVSKQISAAKSTDVVAGKGNGLILLLHGGPGTGKTLTAEGVAEIAQKPLYRVTCGDVGTKAEEVEQYLESVLHLGKIWDCVVLLDEAEVFLERRSLDDLQRNALVSVFLRVIEYHEGILILTSNRVGTFDEAFRSRIQIAVHYPPLRSFQRLQIWKNFFDRLESFQDGKVDVDELRDHLEELQSIEINGRQIRNAITTARQYAEWKDKGPMNYEHLKIALDVAGRFNSYSEKLRGGLTDDQIAEEEGIR